MPSIAGNIHQTLTRIREAERSAGRPEGSVSLLAVSKTRTPDEVRAAFEAGLTSFGENYLQDAATKMEPLADLGLCWHFIGPLQSNKTRPVAEQFDWVQSVDRHKIARRLSEQRPAGKGPLNICLQVNISREASKSGVTEEELLPLAEAVVALPNLKVRGLMAIPAADLDEKALRATFARMRKLFESLQQLVPDADTLSMGMSDDLEAAIAEGATMVRVGTALFGPRPPKQKEKEQQP